MSNCPYSDWWNGEEICGISGPTPCFQGLCHGPESPDCLFPEWRGSAWRACANEVLAFVAATWRDDLTPDQWYALALYWCRDDCNPAGIDELLDAAGWSA